MLFRNFIEERGKDSKEVFWVDCYSNLIFLLQLFGLRELTDSSELILSWRLVSVLLHLVPARETRASSGVLRRRCLSALQELVGRNDLPLLLSSSFTNMFYYLLISIFKFISMSKQIMNDYRVWVKPLSVKYLSCLMLNLFLMKNKSCLCFFPIWSNPDRTLAHECI